METQAQKTGAKVDLTWHRSIQSFLGKFETQIHQVRAGLGTVGDQSRRTGFAVHAGAERGTIGLKNLTTAALGAYASIKSIQAALHSVGEAAASGAGIGRLASLTGVSTQWLSSFTIAAKNLANVSPQESGGALNRIVQMQERFKRFGEYPEAFTKFGMMGINFNQPIQSLIMQMAGQLQKMSGPQAQAFSEASGLGGLVNVLRMGPGRIQKEMAQYGGPAGVTDKLSKSLQDLQQAVNRVGTAWDGLINKFVASNPQLTEMINGFAKWLINLQNTPEGLEKVGTAFKAMSAIIAAILVSMIANFVKANAAIVATPLGRILLLGAAAYALAPPGLGTKTYQPTSPDQMPVKGFSIWKPWTWFGAREPVPTHPATPAVPPSITPSTPGPTGDIQSIPMPQDTGRSGAELDINNFGGLRRSGVNAGPIGGGFQSFATADQGVQATASLLMSYQDRHGLNTLRGIINRWAPGNENDTNLLISRASNATGYGPDQALNLHDSATLARVTAAMIHNEVPQGPGQADVNRVLGQFSSNPVAQALAMAGAYPGDAAISGGAPFPTRGNPSGSAIRFGDPRRAQDYLAWARRGGFVTNHHTNDVDVNGGVHVHVPAGSDGHAIGQAAAHALKASMSVQQLNTGVE